MIDDVIDVQGATLGPPHRNQEASGPLSDAKRREFRAHHRSFLHEYPASPQARGHIARYAMARSEVRTSFEAITMPADRGEDVTDDLLTRLLPYAYDSVR